MGNKGSYNNIEHETGVVLPARENNNRIFYLSIQGDTRSNYV